MSMEWYLIGVMLVGIGIVIVTYLYYYRGMYQLPENRLLLDILLYSISWPLFLTLALSMIPKDFLMSSALLFVIVSGLFLFMPENGKKLKLWLYYRLLILVGRYIERASNESALSRFVRQEILFRLLSPNEDPTMLEDNVRTIVESWRFAKNIYPFPVYIKRAHITEQKILPDWAFSLVVLRSGVEIEGNPGDCKNTIQNGSICSLKINLVGQSYGIYNNMGKEFLRKYFMDKDLTTYKDIDEKFRGWISCKVHTWDINRELSRIKSAPFRWASGGVLPIVKYKGREYVLLVFRSIPPVGWNLFLGGSENKEEYKDLRRLILREFYEELLIVNKRQLEGILRKGLSPYNTKTLYYKPFQVFGATDWSPALANMHVEAHRNLRKREGIELQINSYPIKLEPIETPFNVKIRYDILDNGKYITTEARPVSDVIFTINPFEQGIDVVGVYEFEMDEGDYPLYGEIHEKNEGEFLLHHPIVLISVDKLRDIFSTQEDSGVNKKYSEPDTQECEGCIRINSLSGEDYLLFTYDSVEIQSSRIEWIFNKFENKYDAEQLRKMYEVWKKVKNYSCYDESLKNYDHYKILLRNEVTKSANELRNIWEKEDTLLVAELEEGIKSAIEYYPYAYCLSNKVKESNMELNAETYGSFLTLCPVTWKTLKIAFNFGIL